MKFNINDLQQFLNTAAYNTYATQKVESQDSHDGYKILNYAQNDWSYEDKYTGFYRGFGSETIRFKNEIVWKSNYGGGMLDKYLGDLKLALQTFDFLKLVMRSKPDDGKFHLRGAANFKQDGWEYKSKTIGTVEKFYGGEKILYKNKGVFFHRFIGGVVVKK